MSSCSVPGGHISVALSNGASAANVAVLTVHVVRSRPGVVSHPDSEVLYLGGGSVASLCHSEDLPVHLSHFLQLPQEVPESRLSDHLIGSKDGHFVDRCLL